MGSVRAVAAGFTAGLMAAFLAVGQVLLAEWVGISDLDGVFEAGNERVEGVQTTLLVWFAAVAVACSAGVVARRWPRPGVRVAAVPLAALGALLAWPVAGALAGPAVADEVPGATVAGILLGAAAGVAAVAVPAVGRGIAAHARLVWILALPLTWLVDRTVTYAGLVEPLGWDAPGWLRDFYAGIPLLDRYDFHLPAMTPIIILILLTSLFIAALHRGRRAAAFAAGIAGPVVAAAAFRVRPDALTLWNADAAMIALLVAGAAAVLSALGALLAPARRERRRRKRREAATKH